MIGYKELWKPILFGLDAETAHEVSASLLRLASIFPPSRWFLQREIESVRSASHAKNFAGLTFPNPVGLAAGFDKNAHLVDALPLLGFGFAEIGTVTPRPQKGNPRPRLFRLPEETAILNRMGFNNDGVLVVAKRLSQRKRSDLVIGGNIGKNKDTPNEMAHEDYQFCFRYLEDLVDYFTINVSSPNTPGLRQLLEKEPLARLLESIQNLNRKRTLARPIFLKISPDLEENQLDMVVDVSLEFGLAGIVATNTTINRSHLHKPDLAEMYGSGGLSGSPLTHQSQNVLKRVKARSGDLVLMASGGIMDSESALQSFAFGADLVQVYSGMVYSGPSLPKEILKSLAEGIL